MLRIQKLDLLISVYIFCIAFSELLGAKTFPIINLWGYQLNGSVALFVFPLIFTINDVITEVYGKERTRSIIRSGLVVIFLIFMFSFLATSLPPSSRFIASEEAYDRVFGLSMRISAASLTAFIVSEFLDVLIFVRLRKRFGKKRLWFRNNVSNIVSQLVDTTLFMTLAFYSLERGLGNNILFLSSLIVPYWGLKSLMSVIETPLVYFGINWLKSEK